MNGFLLTAGYAVALAVWFGLPDGGRIAVGLALGLFTFLYFAEGIRSAKKEIDRLYKRIDELEAGVRRLAHTVHHGKAD